jgi:hypothetical protein
MLKRGDLDCSGSQHSDFRSVIAAVEEVAALDIRVRLLALCFVSLAPLVSSGVVALPNEKIGMAQHRFAKQFVDTELKKLLLSNSFYPANLSERVKRLSYCKYGWEPCRSAIEALAAPTDDREVSLVCMEVKGLVGEADTSDQYARFFSNKDYSFEIAPIRDCTTDLVDEKTYTVSVVFSNCTGDKCSARTYAKRNRERCGTGWKTNKFVSVVDGFEFEVLDGLKKELLEIGNNLLINHKRQND